MNEVNMNTSVFVFRDGKTKYSGHNRKLQASAPLANVPTPFGTVRLEKSHSSLQEDVQAGK